MGTELEPEDDEIEVLEKAMKERASHKTTTQKDIEQNPESALPATPFPFARYKAFRISTLCIVFTYVLTMFTLLYIYISDQQCKFPFPPKRSHHDLHWLHLLGQHLCVVVVIAAVNG